MRAAFANNSEIVKLLIDEGADINIQNDYGKTAFDLAMERSNFDILYIINPEFSP